MPIGFDCARTNMLEQMRTMKASSREALVVFMILDKSSNIDVRSCREKSLRARYFRREFKVEPGFKFTAMKNNSRHDSTRRFLRASVSLGALNLLQVFAIRIVVEAEAQPEIWSV